MPRDPRTRFTDRVEAYLRYRPSYPPEAIDFLQTECGLDEPRTVADIGSGTGILTRLLLERGHTVLGVEPNRAMRAAAEGYLSGFDGFTSIDSSAEHTSLASESVDLITSGQAFHWFALAETRRELLRILKPGGWLAILWNDRRKTATPFLQGYEQLLLRHGIDYESVDHTRVGPDEVTEFFGPNGCRFTRFDNRQILDREGLRGRLESSSYAPPKGSLGYEPMITDLHVLFEAHSQQGRVTIEYDTLMYYGQLSSEAASP